MKRKVLISVLAVALVLTLCIGLLVACNPDKDKKPLDECKVTVYYTLGSELKSVTIDAMATDEAGKFMLNEPYNYIPDDEFDAYLAQFGKGDIYGYYYYDASAQDHKGEAFNYAEFAPTDDFAIIIVKESIGTPATSEDLTAWVGNYKAEGPRGLTFVLSIGNYGMASLSLGENSMINVSVDESAKTIFKTSDGKLIFIEVNEYDWDEDGTVDSTYYNYYYLTKNADGSISLESDIISAEFAKVEPLTVTVYYPIDEQGTLHSYEAETMFDLSSGTRYMDEPYFGVPDDPETNPNGEDWGKLDALRNAKGKQFGYYFYDAAATDHKGDAFDYKNIDNDSDFAIIIAIDSIFGEEVDAIDEEWYGYFTATSWIGDMSVEISGDNGGTITLDMTGGFGDPIIVTVGESEPMLYYYSFDDSQLIVVEYSEYMESYNYYFLSKNADGTLTVTQDGNPTVFNPDEKVLTFADLVGKYTSGNNDTLIVSTFGAGENVDTLYGECAGSVIYKGELIYVEFGKTQDGKTAISGMFNDENAEDMFLAIYENNSLTIGTETYAFGGAAMEADISDFSGFWARSDTNQYWSISGSGIKYGINLSDAEYEIIGDYLYMYFTNLSSTYYYLLQVNDAGAAKTLAGTFVEPSKAPQAVTFNATEEYIPTPETLYEYTGDIKISLGIGQTDMRLTKLELDSKTAPTYARATLSLGGGEAKAYALTEGVNFRPMTTTPYPESSYLFKKQIDSAQATFVFAIIDDYTLDIYNFDTNTKAGSFTAPGAPETGGTGGGY